MSQNTKNIKSLLNFPKTYDLLQNILGAKAVRTELVNEFIRPEHNCRILDIGCGTAEILTDLPPNIEYYGYDTDLKYISAARSRFGNRGNFYCNNLRDIAKEELPKFDRILALGVLHHLSDSEARNFFSLADQTLVSGGWVVTIDPCHAEDQNPIARYLISKDRGKNVRNSEGYSTLAHEKFKHVVATLRHRRPIPYTHWIMECHR
jgi:SAM-dependent methyltransferase